MNGATTEPWASTSRPPRTTLMMMMGSSQYLRRAPRKCHICVTKSIFRLLEHVPVAVVRRSRRIAFDPVARLRRLEAPAHRVASERAHQQSYRREYGKEDHAEHDRANHAPQQLAQLHPGAVERREPCGAREGHQGHHDGEREQRQRMGAAVPKAVGAGEHEEGGEGPAEGAIGRK